MECQKVEENAKNIIYQILKYILKKKLENISATTQDISQISP